MKQSPSFAGTSSSAAADASSSSSFCVAQPQHHHAQAIARHGPLCSGHVLINNDREIRHLPCLQRSKTLDQAAREQAETMAEQLHHRDSTLSRSSSCSSLDEEVKTNTCQETINKLCDNRTSVKVAVNILHGTKGTNVRDLHCQAMHRGIKSRCKKSDQDMRDNVLSTSFQEMGLGTARAEDGSMLIVQLFRGRKHRQKRQPPSSLDRFSSNSTMETTRTEIMNSITSELDEMSFC